MAKYVWSVVSVLVLWGCSGRKRVSPGLDFGRESMTSHYDDSVFRHRYDSAKAVALAFSLPDSIKRKRSILFSDPELPDTLELLVPPGPITQTTSVFRIKTASNRIIYNDEFYTGYFTEGVFDPPQLPDSGGGLCLNPNPFLLDYVQTVNSKKLVMFMTNRIDSFFTDVTPVNNKVDLISLVSNFPEGILDTALYNEAVGNPSVKILCVRCYGCVLEVENYFQLQHICYSPSDSVAKPFFSLKYTGDYD